ASRDYLHTLLASYLTLVFCLNDHPTTEISTLSLHDALPIYPCRRPQDVGIAVTRGIEQAGRVLIRQDAAPQSLLDIRPVGDADRSEEHTSELQSLTNIVCRLLLDKKK